METTGLSIKVIVLDYSDGFEIVIENENGVQHRFGFNQENPHERLVEVFKALGYQAKYEDCY